MRHVNKLERDNRIKQSMTPALSSSLNLTTYHLYYLGQVNNISVHGFNCKVGWQLQLSQEFCKD